MNDYLSKPLKPADLAAAISRWRRPVREERRKGARPTRAAGKPEDPEPMTFDPSVLCELLEGDLAACQEIVNEFLAHAHEASQTLRDAATNGDLEALRRASHTLKGAAANVGAKALSAIARRIEELAAQQRIAEVAEFLPVLDEAISSFTRSIQIGAVLA